jgi:hypothetical protein
MVGRKDLPNHSYGYERSGKITSVKLQRLVPIATGFPGSLSNIGNVLQAGLSEWCPPSPIGAPEQIATFHHGAMIGGRVRREALVGADVVTTSETGVGIHLHADTRTADTDPELIRSALGSTLDKDTGVAIVGISRRGRLINIDVAVTGPRSRPNRSTVETGALRSSGASSAVCLASTTGRRSDQADRRSTVVAVPATVDGKRVRTHQRRALHGERQRRSDAIVLHGNRGRAESSRDTSRQTRNRQSNHLRRVVVGSHRNDDGNRGRASGRNGH